LFKALKKYIKMDLLNRTTSYLKKSLSSITGQQFNTEQVEIKTTPPKTNVSQTVVNHHCIMVLDKSGSMLSIREPTVQSVKKFIKEQKETKDLPDMYFTLTTFSSRNSINYIHEKRLLSTIPEFKDSDFEPDGMTALYDALYSVITKFRNEKNVLMVIITDGEENSSETSRKTVFELIEKVQKEDGWKFQYLGANQDSFKTGESIGLKRESCQNYKATGKGVTEAFRSSGNTTSSYRSGF
jgi:hypothetical protein